MNHNLIKSDRKGIILAGGNATRLYPLTKVTSKHLLPVYDKPMIYYPLTTLMLSGIRDILIISTPKHIDDYSSLLKDGSDWGISINYKVQEEPDGLASSFILGKEFIDGSPSALVLGDNIFYGNDLEKKLEIANGQKEGARVFAYHVTDPERYGVIEFDKNNIAISIEEKPNQPKSNFAVTGLYFYDENVCDIASRIKPSERGEYEITDINKTYLLEGKLSVEILSRGHAWLDAGTHESLLESSSYISTIQKRQGLMIACPEEIAFSKGWIDTNKLEQLSENSINSSYGAYLKKLLD